MNLLVMHNELVIVFGLQYVIKCIMCTLKHKGHRLPIFKIQNFIMKSN